MKINKFKKIKNNQYEVTIEENKYKLFSDVILKYNLLIIKEISSKTLDEILSLNEEYYCYELALKYIDIKLRTKKEIEEYLNKKNCAKNIIAKTIEKLESLNMFNHKVYLTSYINDQLKLTNNGPCKIKSSLEKLGFEEQEILDYLDFNDQIWQLKISKYIEKKTLINKKLSTNELKRKLASDLNILGYQSDLINELLSNIKTDDNKSFNLVADKIYNKLSNKYDNQKLIYYFKSKMYNLGYDNELINEYLNKKM